MKLSPPAGIAIAFLTLLAPGTQSLGADAAASPAVTANRPTLAKKYSVQLSPDWQPGQKFSYVADASTNAKTDLVTIAIISHLEAMGEVLAAKNGTLTKMSLTVMAMGASSGGRPVDNKPLGKLQRPVQILAAGAVIVVERDEAGHETFTVDGIPLSGDNFGGPPVPAMRVDSQGRPHYSAAAYYLRMLIDLDGLPGTDQEVFGTSKAVTPGDSWPGKDNALTKILEAFTEFPAYIDPPMAPDPQHRPLAFPPTTVTMKFENVAGTGDDQAAAISGSLAFTGMDLPPQPPSTMIPNLTMDLQGKLLLSCPLTVGKGTMTKTSTLSAKIYRAAIQPPGAPDEPVNKSLGFSLTQRFTFR